MCGDTMDFPVTPEEFIDSYSFKDSKEIYTNGSQLVPIFRVKQMIEHYFPKHGEWITVALVDQKGRIIVEQYKCSLCGRLEYEKEPYCHCGAKMDGGKNSEEDTDIVPAHGD